MLQQSLPEPGVVFIPWHACVIVSLCIDRLTFRRGQLLRKRNFTIVPYSSSHDLHQARSRSPRSSDGPDFHIITNMSDRKVKLLLLLLLLVMTMMHP